MKPARILAALKLSPASAAVLAALLVLAPLYVCLVWSPLAAEVALVQGQVSSREARIEEFARLSAGFRPAGAGEEAGWEQMRRAFERAVPDAPDALGLVARLSLCARQAGIRDAAFKALPDVRRAPGGFSGGAVEMSFHSTYRQLASLTANLAAGERLMALEAVEVSREESGLAVRLVVVGYYATGEPCSTTATS
jgi:hypothetical protein